MKRIDYLQLAKAAQEAAKDCIAQCRRDERTGHYTHRHVEILAIDEHGDRIGDPLGYIDVKQISGKLLRSIVTNNAPGQYSSICVTGGCDGFDSFQAAMAGEDYDPMVGIWEISSNDPEVNLVVSAERVPEGEYRHRPSFLTGSNRKGLNTRSDDPGIASSVDMVTPGHYTQ